MGRLNYLYKCLDCHHKRASYFANIPECTNCHSKNLSVESIAHLNIEKYSDEGREITKEKEE